MCVCVCARAQMSSSFNSLTENVYVVSGLMSYYPITLTQLILLANQNAKSKGIRPLPKMNERSDTERFER